MIDAISNMTWQEPAWLCLAVVPWLAWVFGALSRRIWREEYADRQLQPWATATSSTHFAPARFWRQVLLALAWLLFAMAMAGPRIPETGYAQTTANAPQLMVVLDMSRAMTARDVSTSRLELAKFDLRNLITHLQGLRIGLVVYAGTAHLMVPPTDDKSVLLHDLRLLRYGLLPTAGSNLRGAMDFAANQFPSDATARALLLVTNGGVASSGSATAAHLDESVARLRRRGIFIDALGIGTRQGAPLQTRNGGWLHYDGKAVITRLHARRLRRLAALGRGRYATASDTDWRASSYARVIERQLFGSQSPAGKDRGMVAWDELYGWCLVPGLVLLLLAYYEPRRAARVPVLLPWIVLLLLSGTMHPRAAHAAAPSLQRQAHRAYVDRSYRVAEKDYARVAGYVGLMGQGSSAYRLDDYRQAARLFTRAILAADSDVQRGRALFDLADCRYRQKDFTTAATLYRQTLLYTPHDRAARTNLAFALAAQKRQEARRADRPRPGRGPRTGNAPDGINILHGASLAGPDHPKLRQAAAMPGTLPTARHHDRGFNFSTSPADKKPRSRRAAQNYASTSPERIEMEAGSLHVDQSLLWKRIFARQAGFPAPPKTPREIQGVRPW